MFKNNPCIFRRLFIVAKLLLPEFKCLVNQLASFDTHNNQKKFKAMLIMQSHIIEKGLSLKDTRTGFGIPKIKKLLQELALYENKYHDHETLYFVLSIVEAYIAFNLKQGETNADIIKMYEELKSHLKGEEIYPHLCGGTLQLSKKDILSQSSIDYEGFVKSRHSIRQFTGEDVPIDLIQKALSIAEYTPSACNRQPWSNYVFTKKDNIIKILDIQTGARQFKNDVSCLILITATHNAFGASEYHQAYVNGGLYAMNLMFSLHAMGLGVIPLNLGIGSKGIKELSSVCGLEPSDTPIMLLAVGQIPDHLEVAKSCRFSYTEYSKFD